VSARRANRVPRVRGTQPRRPVSVRSERRTVYIVAEGKRTEREYLGHLLERYGQRCGFHFIFPERGTGGLNPAQVVAHAKERVGADGIDQVWAFFDRDQWTDIPQVFAAARRSGVRVAFSHPAFELWLLLHFQRFAAPQGGDNTQVIRVLRRMSAFQNYDGGRDGKGISNARFEALDADGGIAGAVRNARELDDNCPSGCCSGRYPPAEGHPPGRCDPDRRDPSTGAWRLIEGLGITNTCRQKG
jgi:hypothetical protein